MRLHKIRDELGLRALTPELEAEHDPEVERGHASDLLSDVLANAPDGALLVTLQVHLNVVAVAVHAGLAGVVFSSGMMPEEAVRRKAVEEGLPLYACELSTFETAGRLYALGLRGCASRRDAAGAQNAALRRPAGGEKAES